MIPEESNLMSDKELAAAVDRLPELSRLSFEDMRRNLRGCARICGLTERKAVDLAKRRPVLLQSTPAWLEGNIAAGALCLDVPVERYVQLCRSCTEFMLLDAEAMRTNVEALEERLKIPRELIIKAFGSRPFLFTVPADVLVGRVVESSKTLGVPYYVFAAVALKCPQLLSIPPGSLAKKVADSAGQLGVGKEVMCSLVVKAPLLITRKPESLKVRLGLIEEAARALGDRRPIAEILLAAPAGLCYGEARLRQRILLARRGYDRGLGRLLAMSDGNAQKLLKDEPGLQAT